MSFCVLIASQLLHAMGELNCFMPLDGVLEKGCVLSTCESETSLLSPEGLGSLTAGSNTQRRVPNGRSVTKECA